MQEVELRRIQRRCRNGQRECCSKMAEVLGAGGLENGARDPTQAHEPHDRALVTSWSGVCCSVRRWQAGQADSKWQGQGRDYRAPE